MKHRGSTSSNEIGICMLWGLLSGIAVTAAGLAVCAWLLTVRDFSESAATPMATACLAVAAAVAGFVTARRHRSQGMVTGGLAGLALFLLVLAVSILVSGTEFTLATPVRLLLCTSLGALGGIVGVNLSAKHRLR